MSNTVTENWTCQNSSTLSLTPGKFQFALTLLSSQVPLNIYFNKKQKTQRVYSSLIPAPTCLWVGTHRIPTMHLLIECDRQTVLMKLRSVCWQKSRKQKFPGVHAMWFKLPKMSSMQGATGGEDPSMPDCHNYLSNGHCSDHRILTINLAMT